MSRDLRAKQRLAVLHSLSAKCLVKTKVVVLVAKEERAQHMARLWPNKPNPDTHIVFLSCEPYHCLAGKVVFVSFSRSEAGTALVRERKT